MSAASDHMRISAGESDRRRDAGLCQPEDVIAYRDIVYGKDPVWQALDVYRPKDAVGKLPVIVNVHGGGWVYGDKKLYSYYCMMLAQAGFAVVNFSYRLAPEHLYPAAIEDVMAAFAWVMDHAKTYGLDTDSLFAAGDSAGAHLLGMYINICTNPVYAKKFTEKDLRKACPKAVLFNCGEYTFDHVLDEEDHPEAEDNNLIRDFLPGRGSWDELQEIDVLAHMTSDFPPVFAMTCCNDFLKEQTPKLVKTLADHDVSFECRFYGDAKHPLYHVFHLSIREDAAKQCNADEIAYLKRFI